jgi:parvulin-like peptidyl-prolyl isomerase
MTRMVQWLVIGILACGLLGCGKREAKVVKPSGVQESEVAIWVDQVGITSGQVQQEVIRLAPQPPTGLPPEELAKFQLRVLQQAVDNLVVRQLVKSEMERSDILISQADIEVAKEELQQTLGEGRSLVMLLAEANITLKELENNLRLDIFKNKVNQDKIDAAKAAVTEETAREYYDGHLEQFTKPEGRIVSHILVSVPADADEAIQAERRAKIDGIRKALVEGADFEALAREVSDCGSRVRGGDLGVVPRGREDKPFEDAVYSQNIGDIGEVVRSRVGFHIIRVTGEQASEVVPFEEVQSHIVAVLKSQAQQKITSDYLAELRERAIIKLDGPLAGSSKDAATEEPAVDEPTSVEEEAAP